MNHINTFPSSSKSKEKKLKNTFYKQATKIVGEIKDKNIMKKSYKYKK
jgi:hypothetical protein